MIEKINKVVHQHQIRKRGDLVQVKEIQLSLYFIEASNLNGIYLQENESFYNILCNMAGRLGVYHFPKGKWIIKRI